MANIYFIFFKAQIAIRKQFARIEKKSAAKIAIKMALFRFKFLFYPERRSFLFIVFSKRNNSLPFDCSQQQIRILIYKIRTFISTRVQFFSRKKNESNSQFQRVEFIIYKS